MDQPQFVADTLKANGLTYTINEHSQRLEIEPTITVHDLLTIIMATDATVQAIYRRNVSLEDYYLNLLD